MQIDQKAAKRFVKHALAGNETEDKSKLAIKEKPTSNNKHAAPAPAKSKSPLSSPTQKQGGSAQKRKPSMDPFKGI
jgi:hypothetical protein